MDQYGLCSAIILTEYGLKIISVLFCYFIHLVHFRGPFWVMFNSYFDQVSIKKPIFIHISLEFFMDYLYGLFWVVFSFNFIAEMRFSWYCTIYMDHFNLRAAIILTECGLKPISVLFYYYFLLWVTPTDHSELCSTVILSQNSNVEIFFMGYFMDHFELCSVFLSSEHELEDKTC